MHPVMASEPILDPALTHDIQTIARIAAVPTILEVVARTTGLRFAAVARVTDSTWTACAVYDQLDFGLEAGSQLALESTICNEIRQHKRAVIIDSVSQDKRYRNHHTPALYGFESYISIPIVLPGGYFFGTLCGLDTRPAVLDNLNTIRTLELFAELIASQFAAEQRNDAMASELLAANDTAKLREQFLALVGHDLRSPLGAITLGVDLLRATPLSERAERTVGLIQRSAARMTEMIANILDFARGRLGGGIPVSLSIDNHLADVLRAVVSEVHSSEPTRDILTHIDIGPPIACDSHRLAQLLSNLLANALTHGAADIPVRVEALGDAHSLTLRVKNGGRPIPPEKLPLLFQPFSRSQDATPQPGLGLGLYIAAEIARAHRGTLEVTSNADEGTTFTFRMGHPRP
jgi:signal transduction histidine kinase